MIDYFIQRIYSIDMSKAEIRKCRGCDKKFIVPYWRLKRGGGTFCSNACKKNGKEISCGTCGVVFYAEMNQIKNGRKFCSIECEHASRRGRHSSKETEFKKGQTDGEKNVKWKGNDVGYFALHSWVARKLGRVKQCVDCGSRENIHWANISKKYKRDVNDWKQLCAVCHRKFDGITKLEKRDAKEIKERYKNGETQQSIASYFGVHQATISNIIRNKIKYYV